MERNEWLQVRMTETEKARVFALAAEYGLTLSQLVRMMVAHFEEKRPMIRLTAKKDDSREE